MWCQCSQPHLPLRGMCRAKRIPWTLVAQPYPRGLCRLLAAALATAVGWASKEKLNVARCSRCGALRAGEAQHPGPRRVRARQHYSLEEVNTVSAATMAIEARELNLFFQWMRRRSGNSQMEKVFYKVPSFLPHCLRAYGDQLFQAGGSLFNLRHLLLAAQRWCEAARPYMNSAWEIVQRWESQTPVVHRRRVPVPEALLKAMCSLAWQRRWYTWVGISLLAFYGAGRLGEIIACAREDLVLPTDLCDDHQAVFLRLRRFKSPHRQPAKVQRMKKSTKCQP